LALRNCERYSRRFDRLVAALNVVGFKATKPQASFFCYVKSPAGARSGIRFDSAADAAEYLLKKALISTVPWDEAGAYLRLAVTFEAAGEAMEQTVISEVKNRLERLELFFT
jgi:LL-diaminopimelate aminotransferase